MIWLGALKQVSADRIIDPVTSLAFYEGRIELPTIVDLPVIIGLVPDIPVDTMLQTEARIVLSYLLRPAQDAMSKTLKEKLLVILACSACPEPDFDFPSFQHGLV
ncbi:MAG: hypothetical protein Hens3KO_06280 [Henriciella sp.]